MTEVTYAPGGVAAYLAESGLYAVMPQHVLAAARAAGLVDARGQPKTDRFTEAEIEGPIRAALTDKTTQAEPEPEPEPVAAEDVAEAEEETGRPARHQGRRRR